MAQRCQNSQLVAGGTYHPNELPRDHFQGFSGILSTSSAPAQKPWLGAKERKLSPEKTQRTKTPTKKDLPGSPDVI